jgi:hypothetical protein
MYEPLADDFVLPDGSRFDVSVGLDNQPGTFPCYGEFLAETKSRLSLYGRSTRIVTSVACIDAECGDDEISVASTPVYAAAELAVYSKFLGVKVSEEDTSINPRFGNFAEDLVIVPDGYEQTYQYAQQTQSFKDMSFIDVPKLRLAIDIRPGRMTHSATNDGKASMLGSRLAWLPRDSPVRVLWEVFNLFQDINLGLMRDDKFAYLPTALGGYGKPVPFGKASNFEAIIGRYKQGTHKELCRELVRRVNRRVENYKVGLKHTDEVLSAVSRVQSSWHDWIKGKSIYSPTCWLDAPPEVAKHRVAQCGTDPLLDGALRRLEASGHLVSENDLAIAYEHNMLCSYLLGSETHEEFKLRRKEQRMSWTSMSTFSLRLYGMITKIGIDQSLQHPLLDTEYQKFTSSLRENRFNLRLFLRQEHYYDRKAVDEVYKRGPMMVKVPIMPRVTKMGRRYWFEQTRDSQNLDESNEEFLLLLEWVRREDRPEMPPSMKLLEDDPFIIRMAKSLPPDRGLCIVTDDVRLCRQVAAETQIWVIRVPVKWYYMSVYYGDGDEPWLKIAQKAYPLYEWTTVEDSGSIASFEEVGFRDGSPVTNPVFRPFSLNARSITATGRRLIAGSTKSEIESDSNWKPYRFPEGYLFTYSNFVQRRRHPHRRGWA